MRADRRAGLTLIEVMVALAIFGLGAAGWLTLAAQGLHSAALSHAREAEIRAASSELARASLWNSAELARHSGVTRAQGLAVEVAPAGAPLWRVSVADSGGRVLLTTLVYAPAASSAR